MIRAIAIALGALILPGLASFDALGQETPVVKVACVGDSITEGTANADHEVNSWPRILGRLLEAELPGRYRTGNFGRSGATLLRGGRKPYWTQDVFEQGLAFAPDIVLINLGTNDATNANWLDHGAEFERDCRDLIEIYRGLPSKPRIWLSNLTPMCAPHPRVAECAPHRVIIEEIIARLARELELGVIDFRTPTADQPRLFPDGVHPNTAGNELMARAAFTAITGRTAPSDPTIRPRAVDGERHDLVKDGKAVAVALGTWQQEAGWVTGTGARSALRSRVGLGEGDFHIRARLRMLGQRDSAAAFVLDDDAFGFEGARGTVFRNGPHMRGLRLLHPAELLWEREAWIDFEVVRNGALVWFLVDGFVVDMATIPGPIERLGFDPTRSRMQVAAWSIIGPTVAIRPPHLDHRSVDTPWVDLTRRVELRTVVDSGADDAHEVPVWSAPVVLPAILHGVDHRGAHLPDGRLVVTFRDTHPTSPTQGDLVAWVGSDDDVLAQREGDFTARLVAGNQLRGELRNRALEVLADGTVVATASGRSGERDDPSLITLRFTLEDLVELLPTRGFDLPLIDLDGDAGRHVVVDREPGQYLGHVSTVLLEDGRTILAVYPKGHGRGAIVYKRSTDGGRTWSTRLPTPESWATSQEVPTIHRVIEPATGVERLILWSGLHPARLAVSEDEGASWSELAPVGDWGGIVVMGFVERLADGAYLAMFHDDGRFFGPAAARVDPPVFTLYQTSSRDGGRTWSHPEAVLADSRIHPCEPGCVRSPDGKTLAVLLRENSRARNAQVIFSEDEGRTWSAMRELPASLTGDRHTAKYAPDGRLFICFRDMAHESPTRGDWVGWVGTWEDLRDGRQGQYRVRLKDNEKGTDTTYPGVEVLPDGTFVVTTYGHWDEGEEPYILSARFTLAELDAKAAQLPRTMPLFVPGMNGVHTYRIPALVTTGAGSLIACADARNRSARDLPNDIDTVIRRSTDDGRTWSDSRVILDGPKTQGTADPCLVVDRRTGRIWCAVTWADGVGWRNSKPGFGQDSFHDLLIFSDDDGLTWSKPVDVTEAVKDPAWRSAWWSPGVGLQTESGRLFIPFSAADGDGAMSSYAAVSDDHGATWRRVGPMGSKTNEHMIVQLADGTLRSDMRSVHGLKRRAGSRSKDDGETWSPLEHQDELVEPVCQASLLAIPAAQTPDARPWLVFCNPASTSREKLTLRVSFDGGVTWPISRLAHAGPAAYSCMALLPDGALGLLFEHGRSGSSERISFARIPLVWLNAGGDR